MTAALVAGKAGVSFDDPKLQLAMSYVLLCKFMNSIMVRAFFEIDVLVHPHPYGFASHVPAERLSRRQGRRRRGRAHPSCPLRRAWLPGHLGLRGGARLLRGRVGAALAGAPVAPRHAPLSRLLLCRSVVAHAVAHKCGVELHDLHLAPPSRLMTPRGIEVLLHRFPMHTSTRNAYLPEC